MTHARTAGLTRGADGITRCRWCGSDPLYIAYHDDEWGRPVADDRVLFEKLCLEGFQAGLSWLTILRKRENFRAAFRNFEIERIARFTKRDVDRLLRNEGIIRHRGKIEAAIRNARATLDLIESSGSLASFLWQFEPARNDRARFTHADVLQLTQSPESVRMSKAFRSRGFSFVGPTTMYALMQAMGLVNDHLSGCRIRQPITDARRRFSRPR